MKLEERYHVGQTVVFVRDVLDPHHELVIEAGATAEILSFDREGWDNDDERYPINIRMVSGKFNSCHDYFTSGDRTSTNPNEVAPAEDFSETPLEPGSLDFSGLMEALYG